MTGERKEMRGRGREMMREKEMGVRERREESDWTGHGRRRARQRDSNGGRQAAGRKEPSDRARPGASHRPRQPVNSGKDVRHKKAGVQPGCGRQEQADKGAATPLGR
jgi:hypothetical protein